MNIQLENSSGWITYTPEIWGNRESENPVTVEVMPQSAEDMGQYRIISQERPGFRGQMVDNSAEVTRKVFFKNVGNIKNLSINGEAITTPEALWRVPAMLPLIQEIQAAMTDISVLSEIVVKNLQSQPGGTSKKEKGGTA